jgi:hypothetical protein
VSEICLSRFVLSVSSVLSNLALTPRVTKLRKNGSGENLTIGSIIASRRYFIFAYRLGGHCLHTNPVSRGLASGRSSLINPFSLRTFCLVLWHLLRSHYLSL